MPAKVITKKDTETTIEVGLKASELEPIVKQVFEQLRPRVKAAGFRPGKAPDTIVERELGSNTIQSEVLEAATSRSYSQAVNDLKLRVVAYPEVTLKKFVPYSELEYTAKVEVLPEVKLPDYKKLKLTKPKAEVKGEEVNAMIEDLRVRQAKKTVKQTGAEMGDEVNIDFEGSLDGNVLPEATSQSFTLRLGSGRLVPGFEDHLVGKTTDQETEFDIKMPADYHGKDVAGKTIHFKTKVNAVWQIELPKVDKEFISEISPFESEKELRKDIEAKLKGQKEDQINQQYEKDILDELINKSNFPLPTSLVHDQQHRLIGEVKQNIENRGMGFEEYLKLSNTTEEKVEQEVKPEAERRVRLAILLSEIARAEDLSLPDKELNDEITKLKSTYSDPKVHEELDTSTGREGVYNHLMSQKVIDRIISYTEKK